MGCGGSEENKGEMDTMSGYPKEFNNFIVKTCNEKEHKEFTILGEFEHENNHEPETAEEATFTYKDQKGAEHEIKLLTTKANFSIMFD